MGSQKIKALKIEESIIIGRQASSVFDYTQDYSRRLDWDTFLTRAELMDGAVLAGKGIKAYCVARNGLGMVTEYVSFHRPEVTAIKMTRGPFLFRSFAGSWRFKQTDENRTEVIFTYSFTLRFPFSLIGSLVKKNLAANVRQRLSDLKNKLESYQHGH